MAFGNDVVTLDSAEDGGGVSQFCVGGLDGLLAALSWSLVDHSAVDVGAEEVTGGEDRHIYRDICSY